MYIISLQSRIHNWHIFCYHKYFVCVLIKHSNFVGNVLIQFSLGHSSVYLKLYLITWSVGVAVHEVSGLVWPSGSESNLNYQQMAWYSRWRCRDQIICTQLRYRWVINVQPTLMICPHIYLARSIYTYDSYCPTERIRCFLSMLAVVLDETFQNILKLKENYLNLFYYAFRLSV